VPESVPGGRDVFDPAQLRTRQEFARELTLIRERAGLTVRDVAKAIGMPDSTVGGYYSGRHLPPVKPPDILENLLRTCGVTNPAEIDRWVDAFSRVRRAPGRRAANAPVPYRGLASFQPEDAEWFYGRKRLIEVIVRHLRDACTQGGLLVAVGPSGSGKSSLLRAGVIPALRTGALGVPGSNAWPSILFIPGPHPVHELARQLALLTGAEADCLAEALLAEPQCCRELVTQVAHPSQDRSSTASATTADTGRDQGKRLVIVADQFEEVFATCPDEAERQAFIAALCAAAAGQPGADPACTAVTSGVPNGAGQSAALVVIGLRADFYPHALRYPELVQPLQDRQIVVGPMSEAELRSAILEPAHKAKLDVEDGLVEVLLRDLGPASGDIVPGAAHAAGTLPLLSHALLTTWDRRHRSRLTVADYQASGGIQGAVARTAEEAYEELDAHGQELARRIFLRLVHVADDTADTRRRVARSELLLGDGGEQHVLELFIDNRLVTAETDQVEIAHEALLSAWPRLREWIDADRADGRIQRQLSIAAENWQHSDREPALLYSSGRLAAASEWAAEPDHHTQLNALERKFLKASVEHREAQERVARRRTRRLQALVATLATLSIAVGLLSLYAFQQKAAATNQRNLAISRQVAIDANQLRSTDIALAMQLSLAAYQIAPTPEATSSLLESYITPAATRILGPPGVMQSVATTSGGHIMAAGGENGTVQLWSLADPAHPAPLGKPLSTGTTTIFSVAFSPNGQTLATGGSNNIVRLWDVANPAKVVPWGPALTGPSNTVYSVAFSPNGQILAAGSADTTVRLWNVANPRQPISLGPPITGPKGYVQSVAFSPNGHLLAAGSADNTVWLWNIADPRHPLSAAPPLTGASKAVFSVAFSPSGQMLAAGSGDDKVQLWNIKNPGRPVPDGPPLTGPAGWVNSVAFSPDGHSLAAASSDSNVWIWNLSTRQVTLTLPHPAPVTAVVYPRGSQTLVTSAADGVARLWQIPGPVLTGPTGPIFAAAFAQHHILAVVSEDNTARLWNVTNPRQPVLLGPVITDASGSSLASGAAAINPAGNILVVGAADGSCQVWDVRNPAKPVALYQLHGPTEDIQNIAFSPDGRLLAVTGNNDATWLWNLSYPGSPVLLDKIAGLTNYGLSVAFSPNGHLLAVGSADKLVHLWDIVNPRHPIPLQPLAGASSYVDSVAFSPNGRLIATGSADDKVRIWNISNIHDPYQTSPPLTGPTNYVWNVAFSPDSHTLAATAGDGSVWLWNVTAPNAPQVLATLTGASGAVFIDSYDDNRDILAAGGNDGIVRLWDTDPTQVARYVCSVAGDHITRAEWAKYIPGLPYNPPC
jgi:WD40 repeat protein/transcriptional regulator with XRE-family HTH domain